MEKADPLFQTSRTLKETRGRSIDQHEKQAIEMQNFIHPICFCTKPIKLKTEDKKP